MQQRSMRTFIIIWIGQLISLVGSGMTGFAMGVWLVEETGRATPFGITLAVGTLPRILLAPIAGTYVDRWNRRLIMLVADTLAAVTTGIALVLLLSGELAIWHVYLLAGFGALTGAFQQPASQAIVPLIVPKEKLGQANGMVQAAEAMQFLLSPLLAGLLFVAVGLRGVIAIDLITFVAAVATLLVVHIPDPERSAEAESASGSVWQEAAYGFRFLLERRGLLIMVGYFALVNLFANMAASLLPPMILANAEADVLGIVQMVSGLGMVVGSVVMSAWGGTPRKMVTVYGAILVFGLGFVITGLSGSPLVNAIGFTVLLAAVPIGSGASQVIWQTKVPPDVQGRVFSVRMMIGQSLMPVGFLAAGPLADLLFEPAMAEGGALAGLLGGMLGTGPGRGMGVMFIIGGVLILLATVGAMAAPALRNVEDDLPDYVPATDIQPELEPEPVPAR